MTMKEYRTRRKADIDEIISDTTKAGLIGLAASILIYSILSGFGIIECGIGEFVFVTVMIVVSVVFIIKSAMVMGKE